MSAFTAIAKGIQRVLHTPVKIHIPNSPKNASIGAIWDTGATGSAITPAVVKQLGLVPTGMATVITGNGTVNQQTFTIDILLPNGVLIRGITATLVPALASNCDALIGMDVITMGDFSLTNHNGATCMSFRIPSQHHIDYVKNPTYGITPVVSPKPAPTAKNNFTGTSRNAPCPCGSTKKYKHCHLK